MYLKSREARNDQSNKRIDATNCATETSPKKDVQVALILTMANVVHIVYWSCLNTSHLFRLQMKA